MAKRDDNTRSRNRLQKRVDSLSKSIGSIYQSTYGSRLDNKVNTDNIIAQIDDNLDDILDRVNNQSISNIASLYTRMQEKENKTTMEVAKSLEGLFDASGNIIDTLNTDLIRKSIQAQNYQYETLLKYMPKLRDALNIKKDNVLSSDSFTKECVTITTGKSGKDYIQWFSDRAEKIKEQYQFEEKIDEIYDDCAIYGEYFNYHVPYRQALARLLDRKQNGGKAGSSAYRVEMTIEGIELVKESEEYNPNFVKFLAENGKVQATISFDDSGIIESAIEERMNQIKLKSKMDPTSLTESYYQTIGENAAEIDKQFLAFEEDAPQYRVNGLSQDGVIDPKKLDSSKLDKEITGSVSWKIPRDQIIPVWMGESPVGYLYLEVDNTYLTGFTDINKQYNSLMADTDLLADEWDRQNDMLVSQIASQLADKIDAKFINANLDLKDDIYAVLRYNDKFCSCKGTNNIRCTFLPAEDVQHFYFKLDPKTHRGISDLENALIPGMIWCMAYLNDAIARMSRGSDKRVYYVQQHIEKNVAKTLLNVVNQLKKGNMGMRQLENMNTMFNIIGKFNDHIIPVGNNGDSPIRMEVLNGQQIDTPTDLMDRMEETTLYTLDVPPEFVNSINQVDYAMRFTMSNGNFMKKMLKRQMIVQKQYTISFRKYYNYEFNEHDNTIKVKLPLPAYLATINTTQLFENARNYAEGLANMTVSDNEKDGVKEALIRIICKDYLTTYINFDRVQEMLTQARLDVEMEQEIEDMGDGVENLGNDDEDEF